MAKTVQIMLEIRMGKVQMVKELLKATTFKEKA